MKSKRVRKAKAPRKPRPVNAGSEERSERMERQNNSGSDAAEERIE